MKQQLLETIRKYHMIAPNETVCVAVSGGADSVALLCALKELEPCLQCRITAVHVEHGIRGNESIRDAQFVQDLCDMLEVPLTVHHVDVPEFAAMQGIGIEEAARILRYRVFENLTEPSVVALAHHSDDQAETVLFQLARGTGLRGLCGMPPVRELTGHIRLIRPMLGVTRARIEAYLKKQGQSYCTDATNEDEAYSRNYIRAQVLPAFAGINHHAAVHISETASRLAEVEDYLQRQTKTAFEKVVVEEYEFENLCAELSLSTRRLSQMHPAIARRVIHMAIAELLHSAKDIEAVHVDEVYHLLDHVEGASVQLPGWMKVYRDRDLIVFMKVPTRELYEQMSEKVQPQELIPVTVSAQEIKMLKQEQTTMQILLCNRENTVVKKLTLCVREATNCADLRKKSCTKCLDYDKIKNGFVIRSRRESDAFVLNAKGEHKNVNREWIDAKIPEHHRGLIPIVAGETQVYAILSNYEYKGRVSVDAYVSSDTTYVLEIKEIQEEN